MAECEHNEAAAAAPPEQPQESLSEQSYIGEDVLLTHVRRQSAIVSDSLQDRWAAPVEVAELSRAIERALFSPRVPPKRQPNGTCEANPRLNFYPTFVVPETLATYHIFFYNQKIPASCRANRTRADDILTLKNGDTFPIYLPVSEVPKIFEGLGNEEKLADHVLADDTKDSVLVELKGDNPRLTVVKRFAKLTHFAYPALNLPPKVMETVMNCLVMKRAKPANNMEELDREGGELAVSDEELARWLDFPKGASDEERYKIIEERRKDMMAVTLVTVLLEAMQRFFRDPAVIRKVGESIHYAFNHGYVGLASKISNVELSNLISYMGILHENRLGQSVLHRTLEGEAKRDYIRDTIFLMLIHTWQTAMGVWQQCLETENLKELEKILTRAKRHLWTGFTEQTIAVDLCNIIMPEKLLKTLKDGLPDLVSQSMMQNFRSFILERSGILPAVSNALPTDFVPLSYRECPPPLWCYVYLMKAANFFMYHTDVSVDVRGEGLLEHYCRCNLCTPHRSLATNLAMLNETQLIGTFEIQAPASAEAGDEQQQSARTLKLTAGMWASAFLKKFVPADYNAHKIAFYEDQSKPPSEVPTACVITQDSILAQLHDIKKSREEFLLKKGRGVYLDPHTGERLDAEPESSPSSHQHSSKNDRFRSGDATAPAGDRFRCGDDQQRLIGGEHRRSRGCGARGGGSHRSKRGDQRRGGARRRSASCEAIKSPALPRGPKEEAGCE